MNVLGKVIGVCAGYALDSTHGAIFGIVAGHFVDMYTTRIGVQAGKMRQQARARARPGRSADGKSADATSGGAPGSERRNAGTRYNFTLCVVSLGAKLAKVDGPVTRDEVSAFKEVFRVPAEEVHNVGMMFDRARTSTRGYEAFAEQLAGMFSDSRDTLDEVVTCLFHVALADGPLRPQEVDFIRRVARIFGFSDSYFQRRMEDQVGSHTAYQGNGYGNGYGNGASYGQGSRQGNGRQQSGSSQQGQGRRSSDTPSDPYTVLGIPASTSDKDIKLKYRKLVRENHPDSLVAAGKPKDAVLKATAKLALINAAYDQIVKERQL